MTYAEFLTMDVFAEHPFEGNQLAVFPRAQRISDKLMAQITKEFKFSETTFVLPPEQGGDARVRIFTLDGEAAFAGHPLVGTAVAIARETGQTQLSLETPAGICEIEITREFTRARVTTPAALSIAGELPADAVCAALGIDAAFEEGHRPTRAGMGREYVITELTPEDLAHAHPDSNAFAAVRKELHLERFAILAYAREDEHIIARMFSPLTGTHEDPATGSANVALAGLLLHHSPEVSELTLTVTQGRHMGRPSTLHLHAWREKSHIFASVAGDVVTMTTGRFHLP